MKQLKEMIEKNMVFYGKTYEDLADLIGKKPEALEKSITNGSITFKDLKKLAVALNFTAAQKAYIFG